MEFYFGVVLDFGVEEPFALGEVDEVAVFVFHNVGLLEAGEVFDGFFIAGHPAGFVKGERGESA